MLRTIKSRLLLVLAALSAALLAITIVGWISLGASFDAVRALKEQRVAPLIQLKTVSDRYAVDIVDTAHKVRDQAISWEVGLGRALKAREEIAETWRLLTPTQAEGTFRARYAEAKQVILDADQAVSALVTLLRDRDQAGLARFVERQLYPAIDPVTARLAELVDDLLAAANDDLAAARQSFIRGLWTQGFLTVFGLAAISGGIWVAVIGVSGPMRRLSATTQQLSSRQEEVPIPFTDRLDEVGDIASALESFRNQARQNERVDKSALLRRTILLQDAIDLAPQPLAVVDEQRTIKFMNRAMADLLGRRDGDWEGVSLNALFDALKLPPHARYEADEDSVWKLEAWTADRRLLNIQVQSVVTGEKLVTLSDLSIARAAETERLEQQERMLRAEKSQALVTLASSIAHDFNNLLAVVRGFSQLASESLRALQQEPGLDQAHREAVDGAVSSLDKVMVSAERGRQVVATLNVLTKERRSATEQLDLREAVVDVERLVQILLPSSVRLALTLTDAPCVVAANRAQIEQILTNLCINAVHALAGKAGQVGVTVGLADIGGGRSEGLRSTEAASHQRGVHVERDQNDAVSIFVGLLEKGSYALLQVTDDGAGMSVAVAREAFRPFFTTKPVGEGTGLGLSSVMEFVSAHHGAIHVRSREGIGTDFKIYFPIAAGGERAASVEKPHKLTAPETAPPGLRTDKRILLVDDDPDLVALGVAVLGKAGCIVESFVNPIEALDRFQADSADFNAIILDHSMPGMTGLELAAAMNRLRADIPIVICSGHLADFEREGRLPEGVTQVIRKPYAPADLVKLLIGVLSAEHAGKL